MSHIPHVTQKFTWSRIAVFVFVLGLLPAQMLGNGVVPIVYTLFNQTVGDRSATGTIMTDGTIGVLNQANVLSFDLQVSGESGGGADIASGALGFTISADLTTLVSFIDVEATASALIFGSGAAVEFTGVGGCGFCLGTGNLLEFIPLWALEDIGGGSGLRHIELGDGGPPSLTAGEIFTGISLPHAFASVPEPATLTLLLGGLGVLGIGVWRRK